MAVITIPIQHKGTEIAGRVPAASDLIERQIVINLTDGKLWSKTASGQVVQLGLASGDFSQVALTGKYSDLLEIPTEFTPAPHNQPASTIDGLALVATSGSYNDLSDRPPINPYTLPPATASELGGVKIGSGLEVTGDGTLKASILTVRGQDGTAKTGDVIITRSDLGLDILDANSKILPQHLPDSITGAMVYKGTWNAATNTPTIPAAEAANLGWLYVVSVAGTTDIDGNADWNVSDWLVSDGTVWQRVPAVVGTVVSVNGQTGAVDVNANNLPGLAVVGKTGSYNDLLNVPTEFPPATHTQPASSITGLSTVATSGSYSDLQNIPSQFPPAPHNQPASSITGLATVATSGSYNDLLDLPPDPATTLVGFNAIGQPVLQGAVKYPFAEHVEFADDFGGSQAFFQLYTGNVATVQLNRIRGGVSVNIGSIQYTASTSTVVFTSSEPAPEFLPGDQLEWAWPSNIAQFTCNMLGTRIV